MANRGGRPVDPVWQFYVRIETDGKTRHAKCQECQSLISAKVERLRAHRKKHDKGSQVNEKSSENPCDILSGSSSTIPAERIESPNSEEPAEPPAKRQRINLFQPQVSSFAVKTDQQSKSNLDHQVAKFFYACNIPFAVAEHPEFKKLVSTLRPGYTPPSRKQISGPLLDDVFNGINDSMADQLKGKKVTLLQDGWSDIHNNPVIAHSLHTGNSVHFVSAVETGSNKKTAAFCTSLAQKAMLEASEKFCCEVSAVVTDNEKKMDVMRKELQKEDNELITYGCSAHLLNLVGQDLTPSNIICQIVEINKYFRNHHVPGALLSEFSSQGAVKPQIPGETRWNSQLDCVQTFLTNRPFMVMVIAQNEDVVDVRIVNLINNIGLLKEAKNLLDQLKPVASALDRLQSDHSTIADACEEWLKLLQEESLKPYQKTLKNRFQCAVTPHHILANMLHPKYRGSRLNSEQKEIGMQTILAKDPNFLPVMCSFQAESSPFPKSMFAEQCLQNVTPVVWWQCVKKTTSGEFHELCDYACSLLKLPASSSSIERVFSCFGLVQTKLRNRLGIEKASKLVTCYRHLRGTHELDW